MVIPVVRHGVRRLEPLGFQAGELPASEALSDAEFDQALTELLDREGGEEPGSPE